MAVFTTTFITLACTQAGSQGIVMQLNAETGEVTPYREDRDAKDKITLPRASSASKHYQRHEIVQPSKAVLEAIELTARKYTGARALERANLSPHEWIALYRANIEVESAYNPSAVSKAGAVGLGQLLPITAARLKVKSDDPTDNLRGSAEYLLQLLDTFGAPDLAVAAYNAGPEAVTQNGGVPPYNETREHVRKVLSTFFRLRKHYS
jgi:soluble lytic murein transglycosylase-like protein